MKVLELEKVYYKQGNFIIHDVNLAMEAGSCVALIGPSGSGKTTLIKLIGNVMRADVGRFLYFGKEMYENELEIRKNMSVLFHSPNFNENMKTLQLAEEIRRFEPWFDMKAFQMYMDRFNISNSKRVKELSTGTQRKYLLIIALCRSPKLLIMDEPTSGLDEKSREEVWNTIMEYKDANPDVTILFSTHHKDEVEKYASQVLKMTNGGVR